MMNWSTAGTGAWGARSDWEQRTEPEPKLRRQARLLGKVWLLVAVMMFPYEIFLALCSRAEQVHPIFGPLRRGWSKVATSSPGRKRELFPGSFGERSARRVDP